MIYPSIVPDSCQLIMLCNHKRMFAIDGGVVLNL